MCRRLSKIIATLFLFTIIYVIKPIQTFLPSRIISPPHLIAHRIQWTSLQRRLLFDQKCDGYEIGCGCISGTDPDRPQKVNQDSHFTFRMNNNADGTQVTVIGVMDGHGLKGHFVTNYLQKQLPKRIQQYHDASKNLEGAFDDDGTKFDEMIQNLIIVANADPSELKQEDDGDGNTMSKVLIDSFHRAHLDARMDENIPSARSGTTCVVCAIDESTNVATIANVGDSKGIQCFRRRSDDEEDGDWVVVPLTEATTTKIPTERERIEKSDGRIDGMGNVFYGPVGIAMTRALGDSVMIRAGVLPTPIITKKRYFCRQRMDYLRYRWSF